MKPFCEDITAFKRVVLLGILIAIRLTRYYKLFCQKWLPSRLGGNAGYFLEKLIAINFCSELIVSREGYSSAKKTLVFGTS